MAMSSLKELLITSLSKERDFSESSKKLPSDLLEDIESLWRKKHRVSFQETLKLIQESISWTTDWDDDENINHDKLRICDIKRRGDVATDQQYEIIDYLFTKYNKELNSDDSYSGTVLYERYICSRILSGGYVELQCGDKSYFGLWDSPKSFLLILDHFSGLDLRLLSEINKYCGNRVGTLSIYKYKEYFSVAKGEQSLLADLHMRLLNRPRRPYTGTSL